MQEWICDNWAKCEQDRLSFLRHNQDKLRAELYQGIQDAIADDALGPSSIGKRIVLPSSHIGSPRYMNQLYQVIFGGQGSCAC